MQTTRCMGKGGWVFTYFKMGNRCGRMRSDIREITYLMLPILGTKVLRVSSLEGAITERTQYWLSLHKVIYLTINMILSLVLEFW